MKYSDVLALVGGLALFLYGMRMMSGGLERAAGNRMKQILEKLTSNRFLGVAVGALITAVIQSSSATTVMVVGFVNSSLMTLNQAVWIIMGANIGTTVTGQLIALDVSAIAPLFAFCGVVMIVFFKGEKTHSIGEIIAGLGVLFIGMNMMGNAMAPLQESEQFISIMTSFRNPILGILAGAIFTAIIQSSSASIGILQALAASGVIGLGDAVYVLFGQNIGTCITAVLASIGTKTNAKRTTVIHLFFNTIGTIVFVIICMNTPFVKWMDYLAPGNGVAQIANVHTIFNITTTLLLLPFGNQLTKIAIKLLPDKKEEESEERKLLYLKTFERSNEHQIGMSAIYISQLEKETARMFDIAYKNVELSFCQVAERTTKYSQKIEENEEYLDYLNAEISKCISKMLTIEMQERDSEIVNAYLKIVGNIERIGDHAMNIGGYAASLLEKNLKMSEAAKEEIAEMKKMCLEVMDYLKKNAEINPIVLLERVAQYEQKIDDTNNAFYQKQIERMKREQCAAETSILYSEMLTDFERMGDHALNIAQEYTKIGIDTTEIMACAPV